MVMGGKSEITLLGVMGFQRLMFFNGLFKRSRARRLYSDQCNGSLGCPWSHLHPTPQDALWGSINVHTQRKKKTGCAVG